MSDSAVVERPSLLWRAAAYLGLVTVSLSLAAAVAVGFFFHAAFLKEGGALHDQLAGFVSRGLLHGSAAVVTSLITYFLVHRGQRLRERAADSVVLEFCALAADEARDLIRSLDENPLPQAQALLALVPDGGLEGEGAVDFGIDPARLADWVLKNMDLRGHLEAYLEGLDDMHSFFERASSLAGVCTPELGTAAVTLSDSFDTANLDLVPGLTTALRALDRLQLAAQLPVALSQEVLEENLRCVVEGLVVLYRELPRELGEFVDHYEKFRGALGARERKHLKRWEET
ncbi:MAG: hypothetical protein AB7N76_12555 [Planctomycetota bacterium]